MMVLNFSFTMSCTLLRCKMTLGLAPPPSGAVAGMQSVREVWDIFWSERYVLSSIKLYGSEARQIEARFQA